MTSGQIAAGVALGVVALFGIWYLTEYVNAETDESGEANGDQFGVVDDVVNMAYDAVSFTGGVMGVEFWRAPAQYRPMVLAAEAKHGIKAGILERLLYQESRYREDIITGRVRSRVGAMGIAQFMPATAAELGIDPLNPTQAIDAAGKYLARMFAKFGDWPRALAAYNWGPGNVQRKGLAKAPSETQKYYKGILADAGYAGDVAYV